MNETLLKPAPLAILAALAGAAHGAAFGAAHAAPLQLTGMIGLALLMLCLRAQRRFPLVSLVTAVFWFVSNAVALRWFAVGLVGPQVFGIAFGSLLFMLLCIELSMFTVMLSWAAILAAARLRSDALACVLLAGALSIGDSLREWLLLSFPWLYAGYAHLDSTFAALMPYMGIKGATWWIQFTAFVAAALILSAVWRRLQLTLVVSAFFVAALLAAAHYAPHAPAGRDSLRVAIMQTAVPTREKFRASALGRYIAELSRFAESHDANLILAPETAIPVPLQSLNAVQQGTLGHGATARRALLFGIFAGDSRGDIFNSAVLLQRDPGIDQPLRRTTYIKQHLAPFGEYSPNGLRWLTELLDMPMANLQVTQDAPQNFQIMGFTIIPSVCLDLLYGEDLRTTTPQPRVLVNLSNMAFFSDQLGPRQFLQIARARALEQQVPVLLAANYGPTGAIDANGKIDQVLAPFAQGALDLTVHPQAAATLYARYGDMLSYMLQGLGVTLWVGIYLVRHRQFFARGGALPRK